MYIYTGLNIYAYMHHFSFRMGMLTQARATGIYQVTSSPFYCDQELMKCKLREMLAIVPGTKTELKAKKKKKKSNTEI